MDSCSGLGSECRKRRGAGPDIASLSPRRPCGRRGRAGTRPRSRRRGRPPATTSARPGRSSSARARVLPRRRGPAEAARDGDAVPCRHSSVGDSSYSALHACPPTVSACAARSGRTASSSQRDRKSTRLNSSHPSISYAVFCLKKKKKKQHQNKIKKKKKKKQ